MRAKLAEIRQVVEQARSMPMSASAVVNRGELLAMLDELAEEMNVAFEEAHRERGPGWWGERPLSDGEAKAVWGRIHVRPLVLEAACPPAGGDHAGFFETSMLLAVRPELVEQGRLDATAPWYCRLGEERSSATAVCRLACAK